MISVIIQETSSLSQRTAKFPKLESSHYKINCGKKSHLKRTHQTQFIINESFVGCFLTQIYPNLSEDLQFCLMADILYMVVLITDLEWYSIQVSRSLPGYLKSGYKEFVTTVFVLRLTLDSLHLPSASVFRDGFRAMSQNFVFGSFYWITNENWLVGGTVTALCVPPKPSRVDSTHKYCWWKVNQGIHSSLVFFETVSMYLRQLSYSQSSCVYLQVLESQACKPHTASLL